MQFHQILQVKHEEMMVAIPQQIAALCVCVQSDDSN